MAAALSNYFATRYMNLSSINSVFCMKNNFIKIFLSPSTSLNSIRPTFVPCAVSYAKKTGKAQPVSQVEEEVEEVNKNPQDLVKYCVGSNYFIEGKDIELKPDSEYPDWLWDLHIGPPKQLEELETNTIQYWRKLRKLNIKRNNRIAKLEKF
ncbi:39S ribosomal protein L54, mitochondrial [Holothuria leucospilota]|uniref:Large ribosomal subunit protein mL54 n=1 Tax=Holothuria leucospilota TaxID=206669 RepID=A0A9Q1H0B8_HOLLE|nr:39S ribosomal protein L54, mitochondrial [Holothuria leucospilota]